MSIDPLKAAPARGDTAPGSGRRYRWHRLAFALLSGAAGCLWLAGIALVVPDDLARADVILVLGGDGPPRAERAAELFRAGLAPVVLVSGDGDCWGIHDTMVARGVPSSAVLLECQSSNTFENAALSSPILQKLDAGSATLVTSWFHMRRALACLSASAPRMRWTQVSAPPAPGGRLGPLAMFAYTGRIVAEVTKLAWYAARYGVIPAW